MLGVSVFRKCIVKLLAHFGDAGVYCMFLIQASKNTID